MSACGGTARAMDHPERRGCEVLRKRSQEGGSVSKGASRMDTRLFVDGLPSAFTDHDLRALFAPHGTVVSAQIVRDSQGQSLEFGHVEMATPDEIQRARQALHRTWLNGRILLVAVVNKQK